MMIVKMSKIITKKTPRCCKSIEAEWNSPVEAAVWWLNVSGVRGMKKKTLSLFSPPCPPFISALCTTSHLRERGGSLWNQTNLVSTQLLTSKLLICCFHQNKLLFISRCPVPESQTDWVTDSLMGIWIMTALGERSRKWWNSYLRNRDLSILCHVILQTFTVLLYYEIVWIIHSSCKMMDTRERANQLEHFPFLNIIEMIGMQNIGGFG